MRRKVHNVAVYLAFSVIREAPDVPDEAPDIFMTQTPTVEVREHPTGILSPVFPVKLKLFVGRRFFFYLFFAFPDKSC